MAQNNVIHRSPVRYLTLALLFCLALAPPAQATWSIVLSNTETGEVAIGCATCLPKFDLQKGTGIIVVGKGAAQAQAQIDSTGVNRLLMFNGLQNGLSATEIIAELKATDPLKHKHQYGVVDLMGGAGTHTGGNCFQWRGGLVGQDGPVAYAIQGNILTGEGVVVAAEAALLSTPGDLGQRLMAAMHAAKFYGGDGRCSCNGYAPTSCGCPPESFKKSALVSYLTIARIGDTDGICSKPTGCANGSYYMDLKVIDPSPVDPVDRLQILYDECRFNWSGHADHLLTDKAVFPEVIYADGQSTSVLMIRLVDIDDLPIHHGGALITVTHAQESAGSSLIGAVADHGDGTYSIPLTASGLAGTDIFRVEIEDGMGPVTLYPFPQLELATPSLLTAESEVSAFMGTPIHFSLSGGDTLADRPYAVLGSYSGTEPGFPANGVQVPLNPDLLSFFLLSWTFTPLFPSGIGHLDATGQAEALFDPLPFQLLPLIHKNLSFTWVTLNPLDFASNPVSLRVVW